MIPCPFILIAFAAPASEVGGARHPSSLSLFVGLLTEPCFASLYCALSGLVSDVKLLDPKMVRGFSSEGGVWRLPCKPHANRNV